MNYSISNEDLKATIRLAQSIAKEYYNESFSAPHLLLALLSEDYYLVDILTKLGKDISYLREWAELRIEEYPKGFKPVEEPTGDKVISKLLDEASNIQLKLGKEEIDQYCVLTAITIPNIAFSTDELKAFTINQDELINYVLEKKQVESAIGDFSNNDNMTSGENQPLKALLKFCKEKTSLAKEGKIDPIIGRDKETRMVIEILGRRSKPNVIITGEPGVGKTALVDGLAHEIIQEKVPAYLKGSNIFEMDLGSLVAGASYKGEVEERLKNIIKEVKQFDKAILFIDEIHLLLDSTGPVGTGAANLLKPELARGELTVIGATTLDEYRKFIEKDEAFSRRFEVMAVEEPDAETAVKMLEKIMPFYETHHELEVDSNALEDAVQLAKRYLKERRLPDAAIDLMDKTMSAIRLMDEISGEQLNELKDGFEKLEGQGLSDYKWFFKQLNNKISPVLLGQIEDEVDYLKIKDLEELKLYIENKLNALESLSNSKKGKVEGADIAAVVAHKTGIPMGKIQAQEKERILNAEGHLKKRVIGQDYAIKTISEAILESRSGLIRAGQPIGSFFFLGPTGTGKTELSKSLAEFLFDDESALMRFDMSEFKEEHTVSIFLGAPAGYAGYGEGGSLVNAIREKPYSVVLFDEIEKAHKSIFDIFLQILDEGKISDREGREGDFSNAVILFTSNIGSRHIIEQFSDGKQPTSNSLMEIMSAHFRPEFLARVTEIVPFAPISEENVVKIFDIHLSKLNKLLKAKGITLNLGEKIKKELALYDFTQKYGARQIASVIRNKIRKPLSRRIVSGELLEGDTITPISFEDGILRWSIKKT